MKLHLKKDNKETICGGRISGIKSTDKKNFFSVDREWFEEAPVKERCAKCQAIYEAMQKNGQTIN